MAANMGLLLCGVISAVVALLFLFPEHVDHILSAISTVQTGPVNWGLAFASGSVAAVSPCVIVLVPLILFRFSSTAIPWRQRMWEIFQFTVGFQTSYLLFGYVLASLLTSAVQNGIKIGFGSLFAISGTLAAIDRLDPLSMPVFSNPLYLGVSFSLIVTINPCTVPFLAVIISLSTADALLSLFFFGMGLITPSLAFALIGRGVIVAMKKWGKIMHYVNKSMSVVLAVAGFYLTHSVRVLSPFDLIVASALFVAAVILVLRTFDYFILSPKPLTVAVLFGAVTVTGALSFYAGWSGEHVEYAHIDVATLADGAGGSGGGGEGQCVDVSMLPDCPTCHNALFAFTSLTAALALVVLVSDYIAWQRLKAVRLPSKSPDARRAGGKFPALPPGGYAHEDEATRLRRCWAGCCGYFRFASRATDSHTRFSNKFVKL